MEVPAYTFVSINEMGTTDCGGMDAYNDSLLAKLAYVGQNTLDGDGPFLRPFGPCYPSSLHEYHVPSLDQGPRFLRMAGMTESGSITGLCEEAL